MLYTKDLESIIFNRHEFCNSDELIIVSGYIGPGPTSRLSELPIVSNVYYGMVGEAGVSNRLHNSLLQITEADVNTNIYYSQVPIHAKCYAWRDQGAISQALIGSANFSTSGLCTPHREVLADVTSDSFDELNRYIDFVQKSSVDLLDYEPQVGIEGDVDEEHSQDVCSLSLVMTNGQNKGQTHNAGGLNWGQNPDNHTNLNDAYIPIKTRNIRRHPKYFPPKALISKVNEDGGRPQRQNDPIDIIWDDGTRMRGLLEGTQPIEGTIYPKQISSFPDKSLLGIYFRKRLGVRSGCRVEREDLDRYGRTDVHINMEAPGVYFCDFSKSE